MGHGGGLGSQVFADAEAHRRERVGPERLDGHGREEDEAARLHAALTSTETIPDAEDDECEQAFDRLEAGLENFRRQHEGEGTAEDQPPSVTPGRAQYLQQCRARPAAERRCLGSAYRTEHADECQRLSDRRVAAGEAIARRARHGEGAHVDAPPPPDPLLTPLPAP